MRFVDEFRDADLARALATQIAGLCEPGRKYKFMEVCGGHTHTIYKHGIEDYLPEAVSLVHGPGCPVCVLPMGRIDDAIAIAEHDDVILTSFGDMMRVPGGRGSFFDSKAAGADIRMVYSPLDALKIARQNPDKRVVFMAIGFETTAPSTAMTVLRAKAEGIENFSIFCNHVTIIPAIKAILDSPDLRLDGFIGPGHVSTVIGCRPYHFISHTHGKPLVCAGFEPLDVLQSVYMILKQLSEGRSEVENQYSRVVPWDGNVKALQVINETMELRPYFEWRGLGFISQSALKLRDSYAAYDAEVIFEVPGVRVADPKACQCGEVLKGVIKPYDCKVFGTACTPETPIGTCMVSSEGACAAYYNFGRFTRKRVMEVTSRVSEQVSAPWAEQAVAEAEELELPRPGEEHRSREEEVLARIERARARKPRVKEERITLAHGSGGKATHTLVEAIFLDHFRNPLLEPLEDQAILLLPRAGGQRLAFTTDSYVVSPLFFNGGNIGDLAVNGTVNDLAVSGARPMWLSAGFILEEGFPVADLERIVQTMAEAAAAAGVQIVTGDTKVVQRGKADGCYVNTAGVGVFERDIELGAARARPGDAVIVSGQIGDHGVTVMLARGELDIESDLGSDTAALNGLVDTLLDAVPNGVHAMRDATRGGVATILNEVAKAASVAVVVDEASVPVRPEVTGASEILGIDPLYVACEGRLVAVVAEDAAEAALAALRSHPLGQEAAVIGRVADDPPGLVLLRTSFGGTRIVDMLVGDPLPRIC